jgi:hypothetical protein
VCRTFSKSLKERGGHGRFVIVDVTDSREEPAMTRIEPKPTIAIVKELFSNSPDVLPEIVRAVMQEMLEAEMTDALGADKGERTPAGSATVPAITAVPWSRAWKN